MNKAAAKAKLGVSKFPKGPHPLTLKGERGETKAQERAESPAFERAEKKLGIEGKYGKSNPRMKGAKGAKYGKGY